MPQNLKSICPCVSFRFASTLTRRSQRRLIPNYLSRIVSSLSRTTFHIIHQWFLSALWALHYPIRKRKIPCQVMFSYVLRREAWLMPEGGLDRYIRSATGRARGAWDLWALGQVKWHVAGVSRWQQFAAIVCTHPYLHPQAGDSFSQTAANWLRHVPSLEAATTNLKLAERSQKSGHVSTRVSLCGWLSVCVWAC